MKNNSRKIAEGWCEKVRNQLDVARSHLNSGVRWSEAVQAAQECVELSVKSLLTFLQIEFALTHGWNREALSSIAAQIQNRQLISKLRSHNLYWCSRLPRLLILANFWAQFYLLAKYGMEQSKLAPPQELFQKGEAELAVQHAEECLRAVTEIRYLSQDKLDEIISGQ